MATGTVPTTNVSGVVDELVAQQYLRGKAWDQTKTINPVLERLEKNGNIKTDASGTFVELKARVGEWKKTQRADLAERNFQRKQHYVTYRFPWSWHEVIGALSERDIALLGSKDAIYAAQKEQLKFMSDDFFKGMNFDVLQSHVAGRAVAGINQASGSDVPLYGLLSMFDPGATATAWNPDTETTSTTTTNIAASKERLPQGTYGGISTNPSTAIAGVDDKATDATSPIIYHSDATGFGNSWTNSVLPFLSYAIMRQTRSQAVTDRPDLAVFTRSDYLVLKDKLRSDVSQQVVIIDTPTAPDAGMYPRTHLNYEGVTVLFDTHCPADTQFILNTHHMGFHILPQQPANFMGKNGPIDGAVKEIFKVDMAKDIDQGAWKIAAQLCGQLVANPFYQGLGYKF